VSISERRKSRLESRPIVSRRTQRRPVGAAMLHRDFGQVNATELARRQILRLTAGAATLPALSRIARAQAYPTRPVRIIDRSRLLAALTSSRACLDSGSRNVSVNNSSSRTGLVRPAISAPRLWCAHLPTAIRSSSARE
jgi:hypothetical protein